MKWLLTSAVLVALVATAHGQEFIQEKKAMLPPANRSEPYLVDLAGPAAGRAPSGFLTGNTAFPNFIGFMSNPVQSIDPRAVTTMWPIFSCAWADSDSPHLPGGNVQVYGAGLNLALSDRLSIGLNQGGWGEARFTKDRELAIRNAGLLPRDRDRGGLRSGWLNLGGFAQYTLIADQANQFLLTAGMRWEAPSGATQMFQGSGPAYLAPYLTAGKEFGCWHFLATTGYEFPVGAGDASTNTFYLNLHVDRKIGWLYPLVELNGAYRASNFDINLQTRHGVIDLGSFSSGTNSLAVAAGANAVLVPGRLEFGAVYVRPITSLNQYDFNSLLVKMTYRY